MLGQSWGSLKLRVREGVAEAWHQSNLQRFRHKGKVLILTYHRVLSNNELTRYWVQPGMYVRTDVFEQHMQFLQEHFEVLSFHELLSRWRKKEWDRGRRYCVITFDDGWLDNFRYAYPVLKNMRLPATIFLPTDFIGTNEWFWPEKLLYLIQRLLGGGGDKTKEARCVRLINRVLNVEKQAMEKARGTARDRQAVANQIIERCKDVGFDKIQELIVGLRSELEVVLPEERLLVNWEEVDQMANGGISFGSHSCSHRILTELSVDDVKVELQESQRILKQRVANYLPVFCYPNGNTNSDIQALAMESGYQAAAGVCHGVEDECPENLFDLRRIGIHNDMTATLPLYSMRLFAPLVA